MECEDAEEKRKIKSNFKIGFGNAWLISFETSTHITARVWQKIVEKKFDPDVKCLINNFSVCARTNTMKINSNHFWFY